MVTKKAANTFKPRPQAPAGKVVALQRGLDVLACFEAQRRALGHAELARLTGLPKPTLSRMLTTLKEAGFLRLDAGTEKYSLGPRVVALANIYISSFDIRALARPLMQVLADRTGLSVYLAIAVDLDMLIIEVARPPSSMLVTRLDIGSRVPMSTSALGRAYLLDLEDGARLALLKRMEKTYGSSWASAKINIESSLRKSKRLGYCQSLGELYPDIHSIAKAIRLPTGETVVLNCGGPSNYLSPQMITRSAAPALLETVDKLRKSTGQKN